MLKTRMGTTVEFIRLDKWAVRIVVSIPHTKGMKVVASPIFTIDLLREELKKLEQAKIPKDDADICGRLAKGDPDSI